MIISHKHRFIFLKTNKTAGTSIEIALSKYCGDEDIITPIDDKDEAVRQALGYRGPQNFSVSDVNDQCFYNHIPAATVKQWVKDEVWNNYFKFCFERNPWDKIISLYYWRIRKGPGLTLSQFLSTNIPYALKTKGFNVYTINGKIAVDKVFLYEELDDNLVYLQQHLGLGGNLSLPVTKAHHRKDHRHYSEILSDTEAKYIASMFNDEIRLFNYNYQETSD